MMIDLLTPKGDQGLDNPTLSVGYKESRKSYRTRTISSDVSQTFESDQHSKDKSV